MHNFYTILTTQSSTAILCTSVIKPVWFAHFAANLKASPTLPKGVVTSVLMLLLGGNIGIILENYAVVSITLRKTLLFYEASAASVMLSYVV